MDVKMKKWRLFAIIGYCIPLVLFMLIKFFSKWGADIENCIFAFLVGVVVECIIGIFGLIGICNISRCKERIMFLFNIAPLILLIVLFIISRCYA